MNNIVAKQIFAKTNFMQDKYFSVEAIFPRIILAELNTHKMLSKNSASSRAIPFDKMVKSVQENPFVPIAWQKEHKGMQGTEYLDEYSSQLCKEHHLKARDNAVLEATMLHRYGATKQLANRLLEPFMYHKVLITGTEWANFFNLRCPQYQQFDKFFKSKKELVLNQGIIDKDSIEKYINEINSLDWLKMNKGMAEIHMMALAEAIYDEYKNSPESSTFEDWCLPYIQEQDIMIDSNVINLIKVSTGRCARTSYTTPDKQIGETIFSSDVALHDRLLFNNPPHSSPAEHPAYEMMESEYFSFSKVYCVNKITERIELERQMGKTDVVKNHGYYTITEFGWCNNLRGFVPYRFVVDNGGFAK